MTVLEGADAGAKLALAADGAVVYTSGLALEQARALVPEPVPVQTGRVAAGERTLMADVIAQRPHLVVIGGVHVAVPLTHFAHMLGFKITLIDPREAFASAERSWERSDCSRSCWRRSASTA